HLRLAGHMMPNGFRVLGDLEPRSPVQLLNRATGVTLPADVVMVYSADVSAKARILNAPDNTSVLVDVVDGSQVGDPAQVVTPKGLTEPPPSAMSGPAPLMGADACLVRITGIDAAAHTIQFASSPQFNSATNEHCDQALRDTPPP